MHSFMVVCISKSSHQYQLQWVLITNYLLYMHTCTYIQKLYYLDTRKLIRIIILWEKNLKTILGHHMDRPWEGRQANKLLCLPEDPRGWPREAGELQAVNQLLCPPKHCRYHGKITTFLNISPGFISNSINPIFGSIKLDTFLHLLHTDMSFYLK